MLTQDDLQKIKSIVDTSVDQKLDIKLKPIKKDILSIKKDVKTVINVFDRDIVHLRKRIDRVENHLHLPPSPSDL